MRYATKRHKQLFRNVSTHSYVLCAFLRRLTFEAKLKLNKDFRRNSNTCALDIAASHLLRSADTQGFACPSKNSNGEP